MGLILSVYRNATRSTVGDCTNGGVTALHAKLTAVNVPGPFDPAPDRPAVELVPGAYPGIAVLRPVLEDGDERHGMAGPMFGGNYAATSDSRFGRAVEKITGSSFYGAVPVHDRFDTWEDYERLTR